MTQRAISNFRMQNKTALFKDPFYFVAHDRRQYSISQLTKKRAQENVERLVDMHNTIPLVKWNAQELLADSIGSRIFPKKWDLSVTVNAGNQKPIAFLIAYERNWDKNHPLHSVYLHRGAVNALYQHRGIWRSLIEYYIYNLFLNLNDFQHITVQTNDTPSNQWLINFYESVGFYKLHKVLYPEKVDWLFAIDRTSFRTVNKEVVLN